MLVTSELFLFMLPPWLLPIVLFHILIVCVSLWSFDCFSWSLRSLSNLFIVAQYCFVTVLGHCFVILVFLWSLSSLFIHFACLHVCFESGVYHICNIWESKPIIPIISSHFARLRGCCPWFWDCFGLSVVYLHGYWAPFLIISFFLSFSVTFWPC